MSTRKRAQRPFPAAAKHINELLDEALEQTFPASDPVAISIETGDGRRLLWLETTTNSERDLPLEPRD